MTRADDAAHAPTAPLYAVVDRRRDGRRRVVSEHVEPREAASAAEALRAAGANVHVELIARD